MMDTVINAKTGEITTQESPAIVQESDDIALANLRSRRNALLAQSDWTQLPDAQISNATVWATYRQALRDLPVTTDIHNPVFPNKPE
tara:strand:- start:77 stop:337 length:261 start_codon:yes stop_codon:yes gene_type:complete